MVTIGISKVFLSMNAIFNAIQNGIYQQKNFGNAFKK